MAAMNTRPSADAGVDWAAQTADTIERVVGSVRAKTADPLEQVARLLVYGLLAAVVGLAALVLVTVGLVRGLVILLDLVWQPEVWLVYLVLGIILALSGLWLWRKRSAKTVKV